MMDTKKQAVLHTIGNMVYILSLWLLTVITTQLLGYEAVGNLTLAMAIGNVVLILQLYGVRGFQSSDIIFCYSPNVYLKTRLFTMCCGILLGVGISVLLGYPSKLIFSIFLFILVKSTEAVSDVFFGDDQRLGKLELVGYSMFFRGIMIVLLFFIGVYTFKDLNLALLMIAIGSISLTMLLDYPLYRRTVAEYNEKSVGQIDDILIKCFPLLITTLIPAIITAVPRVALSYWHGTELLGYYGNLSTPALLIITLVPNFLMAFLPQYGKMVGSNDYHGVVKLWRESILGTLLLSGICLIGVFFWGRPLLAFIYTKQILPYVHFLYYVLIAMAIYAVEICCATALVAMRKNKVLAGAALSSLVICLTISIPLVRDFGIGGAIAVLVFSYSVQVIIQFVYIIKACILKYNLK